MNDDIFEMTARFLIRWGQSKRIACSLGLSHNGAEHPLISWGQSKLIACSVGLSHNVSVGPFEQNALIHPVDLGVTTKRHGQVEFLVDDF